MTSQLSAILTIALCLVKISLVISWIAGDNFETPVENTYDDDNVITGSAQNGLDCTKFGRDYDILRSLPFAVVVSPLVTINKTYAIMNLTNHVTELTIYKERLIPLNVYCLKNLNSLTIYNTNFYEYGLDDESVRPIPAEIGLLSSLRTLHIYDSPVQRLPNEFGKLSLLTQVSIINGSLREIPTFIENLSLLQSLRLSDNKLISLPSTMRSLTVLSTLDLNSNLFTSIDELNGMRSLQNLYAQNCNIKYIPNNMAGLMNLNMSYNRLEELFGIGGFGPENGWKNFDFSYNQIVLIPPEISKTVLYLQTFLVRHNYLTHLPKELFGLQNGVNVALDIRDNLFPLAELNSIKETLRTKLWNVKALY